MSMPRETQIIPNTEPVIHWGVHFVHENVVSVYGPGEEAKVAAEETVKSWADSPYPARLVSQTILPWSADENTKVPLVTAIRDASTDPSAVMRLREWLVNNGYETELDRKTGLVTQVPLIKLMRKAPSIAQALEHLNEWLVKHEYEGN